MQGMALGLRTAHAVLALVAHATNGFTNGGVTTGKRHDVFEGKKTGSGGRVSPPKDLRDFSLSRTPLPPTPCAPSSKTLGGLGKSHG